MQVFYRVDISKRVPLGTKNRRGGLWASYAKGWEEVPVSKGDNAKPTCPFPPKHMVKQSRASEVNDVEGVDGKFDAKVGKTDVRLRKGPNRAYPIEAKVARQLVLVRLRRKLVGVDCNVKPMR